MSDREPNQILEASSNNKNGWSAKEDPNRKLLQILKDEIEKSRNQTEKKKLVFISYAWEKSGSLNATGKES